MCTQAALLALPWLPPPLRAWEHAGREGCRSREPPSLPRPSASAGAHPRHPGTLWLPRGRAGSARSLRSSARENAGKEGEMARGKQQALRCGWPGAAGSCRGDRVFLRPSTVMLKRLRRAEYRERVRWVLAAWLLCSRRECGPRDFAAASFPLARGEQRN